MTRGFVKSQKDIECFWCYHCGFLKIHTGGYILNKSNSHMKEEGKRKILDYKYCLQSTNSYCKLYVFVFFPLISGFIDFQRRVHITFFHVSLFMTNCSSSFLHTGDVSKYLIKEGSIKSKLLSFFRKFWTLY